MMAKTRITKRHLSPTIRCSVSAERIADSCRRSSSHCMIAEALRETLGAEWIGKTIIVDLYYAALTHRGRNLRYSYLLPRAAQLALIDFDRGVVPAPFSFELRQASKITRTKSKRKSVGSKNKAAYARQRYAAVRANEASEATTMAAMNDPDAPLHGPVMVTRDGPGSHGVPTIVGGQLAPVSNFAKNRRFGLRQLAA